MSIEASSFQSPVLSGLYNDCLSCVASFMDERSVVNYLACSSQSFLSFKDHPIWKEIALKLSNAGALDFSKIKVDPFDFVRLHRRSMLSSRLSYIGLLPNHHRTEEVKKLLEMNISDTLGLLTLTGKIAQTISKTLSRVNEREYFENLVFLLRPSEAVLVKRIFFQSFDADQKQIAKGMSFLEWCEA
ncbi:hypothetical protein SCG7109_AG_00300 [Chlamydiales bacterium SCGC AG-110-M15]|nr:hypothetical protein SCG7109_AG_00300 [Chlamydiales bacterium SCGC AG-110-M15]